MKRILQIGLGAVAALQVTAALSISSSAFAASASLKDAAGKEVGTVTLTQTTAGVLLLLSVKGVPAGEHAFHVHAVGTCVAPFTTAGGHFNPDSKTHGALSAMGQHAGDMPNLHVPANGELTVGVLNAAISLDRGKPNSAFDADGSALLIHAGKDDYTTDPTGNAGDRIACGVIQ